MLTISYETRRGTLTKWISEAEALQLMPTLRKEAVLHRGGEVVGRVWRLDEPEKGRKWGWSYEAENVPLPGAASA